jgi:stalled ribosome rescue protein Dom34
MKQIGVWIDKREAKVFSIIGGNEHLKTIKSEIEEFNPLGGSGTKSKGGPQDVVQDSKYLEREKHQLAAFFKDIVPSLENADSIVIFGPAQTGEKLNKELQEKYPHLKINIKSIEKADSMTDNQLKAWVRDYYH